MFEEIFGLVETPRHVELRLLDMLMSPGLAHHLHIGTYVFVYKAHIL